MVFHDVVRDEQYDLWIGDEAWELDYYLHENPELKRAAYVWLTDFVGWLPMPDGGEREALLTADYNAEMIEHIARYPARCATGRSSSATPTTSSPTASAPGCRAIRDWTEQHFDFAGYVTGFDPAEFGDRERLRAELGYRRRRAGLRRHRRRLGRRRRPAAPRDRGATRRRSELVPELRMIVVAGPRIDPASLPRARRAGGPGLRPRPLPRTSRPATSPSSRAG